MNLLVQNEDGTWPEIVVPRSDKSRAKEIIAETAAKHRVSVAGILSTWRTGSIVIARREAVWRVGRETKLSYCEMGRLFNRDHTTMIYTIRRQNDIVGANVRGLGGVPAEFKERQSRFASRYRERTRQEKLRQAENRLAHRARMLFEKGKDTAEIARHVRRPEPVVVRVLHDFLHVERGR